MQPLSPQEMLYYPAVFQKIDQDQDGVVPSGETGQWLQQLVLSSVTDPNAAGPLFALMWEISTNMPLASRHPMAPVQPQEFFLMMRSMACIQNGATPQTLKQMVAAHTGTPLPTFGAITFETLCPDAAAQSAQASAPAQEAFAAPASQFQEPPPQPVPQPVTEAPQATPSFSNESLEEWSMDLEEWGDHQFTFRNADLDGDGKLSGGEAAPLLSRSGADRSVLHKVWTLVDQDSDGFISSSEFCAGMHLSFAASKGRALPSQCPQSLLVRPSDGPKKPSVDLNSLNTGLGNASIGASLEDAPLPPLGGDVSSNFGQPQANAFGQPQGFGQPAGGAFGQPQQQMPASNDAFGQPAGGAFGQPQADTGAFGQPAGAAFGQPQQNSDFGSFGQPQQPAGQGDGFGAFGQPGNSQVESSPFGQPQADTGAFGQPAVSNAFAQPQSDTGAFGPLPTSQHVESSPFGQPQGEGSAFGAASADSGAFGQPAEGRRYSLEDAVANLESEEQEAANIEAVKEEKKKLHLQTVKVERERRERQGSITALEQERSNVKAQLEELRGKQLALDESVEREQREHGRLKQQVSELKAEYEAKQSSCSQDTQKLESLRVEIRGLEEEKVRLEGLLPDASTNVVEELKQAEAAFLALRAEVTGLREMLGNVEQETLDRSSLLQKRKSEIEMLQREKQQVAETVAATKAEQSKSQEELLAVADAHRAAKAANAATMQTPDQTPEQFEKGEVLLYLPTGEAVEVVKVHKEDFPNPPYYSIKMQDLREKQTTFDKLKRSPTPLEAPKEPEPEMLALPAPAGFEQPAQPTAPDGGTAQDAEQKPTPPENLVGTPDVAVYGQVLGHVHYQQAAQAVFAAYNGFFDDIRLRKGWKEIPFTVEDMKIIFHVAAQVVAVLRARLDVARVGISLRKIDGEAPNFLWGLEKNPNPLIQGQDRSFVAQTLAGLVKATMSDGKGFVEGMDEQTAMQFVRVHPWVLQHILGQPVPQQNAPAEAQPASQ